MPAITREESFESNIEAHLLDHRWHKVEPKAYDKKLGLFPDDVIEFVETTQPKAWDQLKTRHGGEQFAREKFLKSVADAIDHRGTIDVLRQPVKDSGVTVRLCYFKPASGLNTEQLQRYGANRLAVIRQLTHSESNTQSELDLCLAVNGIPVATAELKNPLTKQTYEHAMAQYRTARNPHDLIFARRTLVHFAVDQHHVAMTTQLKGDATVFLPFDQGSAGAGNPGDKGNPPAARGSYQTSYLWEQVWQRDAWLDLLGTFIHKGEKGILFPRFHQWHAVRALLAATRGSGAGVDRLIQHSAGSGKSNTIAWSAHTLSRLHNDDDQPIFDKVVVITDRKVLDKQLQATVAGLDHTPGTIVRVDKHSSQLKEALQGNAARIIITTLQKFPVVAEMAAKEAVEGEARGVQGRRFAVIVDEAHSSSSGEGVKQLKKVLTGEHALEAAESAESQAEEAANASDALIESALHRGKNSNISFFAFTATPKPKTLELFGQTGPEGTKIPFHTYSMRQAIAEGFILDVLRNYTTYAVYYKLANAKPENDIEVDAAKGRAALARFVSLHPYALEQKAEIIVEHFRQKTAAKIDGRAKAMVVTRSRLHAVRTKQAIDRYVERKGYDQGDDAVKALVAFSSAVVDPEMPEVSWTEAGINGIPESQVPKAFRDEFQVLVVAEKYQTGFDEPLLHTMYVDKKLAGVKAVQTLSRLNRTAPGKDDTFVLDFANSAEEIQKAFEPFFEQTEATPTDPQLLYRLDHDLWSAGVLSREEVLAGVEALLTDDPALQPEVYAQIEPAVGRFVSLDEDGQEAFRARLDHFVRAYAFLAQVIPWTDPDLERLYLYGKVLILELPGPDSNPMPQLGKAVQLTHLRLASRGQTAIELEDGAEPGSALPGEGKGSVQEPIMEKLSAIVAAMNEKFGSELGEGDKVLIEQVRVTVKEDQTLRDVAVNNDRSQFELVLEQRIKELLIDRHEQNGHIFDLFFAQPEFQRLVLAYVAGTYDEFRREDTAG